MRWLTFSAQSLFPRCHFSLRKHSPEPNYPLPGWFYPTLISLIPPRKPGYELTGARDVFFVTRFAFLERFFKQRHARDTHQQRHQQRAEDGPPAACRQRDQVIGPPLRGVAEVVRMARVAPDTYVQHFAFIVVSKRDISTRNRNLKSPLNE